MISTNKLVDVRAVTRLAKTKGPEARAAEDVANIALNERYRHAPGLGWLRWDGRRWSDGPTVEARVHDDVRVFADAVQRKWDTEAKALRSAFDDAVVKAMMEKDSIAREVARERCQDVRAVESFVSNRCNATEAASLNATFALAADARDQANIWLNLMSAAAIASLTKLAARMDGIRTDHRDLDAHADLLNVENGVVNLRTGELGSHDPNLLITKLARGEYRPGASCPRWNTALRAVHPELRDWLQVRAGQSATGYRPDDDVMFVCWGGGANGKSTVLNAVRAALGDYAGLIPHRALMASADAHPTELTTFRGLRFALMEETPEEGHLDMHRVKTTVGTPTITARKIRQDDIEFATTHTMWINTNHKPQVSGADHATWRRLLAVPWPFTFVAPGSPKKTSAHLDGDRRLRPDVVDDPKPETSAAILTWLVEGAVRWYQAGRISPEHPAAVLDASSRWRIESDVALLFVQDRLVAQDGYYITGEVMREAFKRFLDEQGKRSWTAQTINSRLPEAMVQAGITLTATPDRPTKVRAADTQSHDPDFSLPPQSLPAGKLARRWYGVRFRTAADDAADQLRTPAASA